MIILKPHSDYCILYKSGDVIEFRTTDTVPEAKHLIRVLVGSTGEETDLVRLLLHPWVDVVEMKKQDMPQ